MELSPVSHQWPYMSVQKDLQHDKTAFVALPPRFAKASPNWLRCQYGFSKIIPASSTLELSFILQ
jgi:hypothetical protein